MNRLVFAIVILNLFNHTAGQSQRYDYNWVFGYDGGNSSGDKRWGTSIVNFNSGNPIVRYQDKGRMYIYVADASISNKLGDILYYTNGYDVEDSTFKKVPGAINLGIRYWEGLISNQGVMFLPMPSNTKNNYLFYVNKIYSSSNYYIFDLKYLIINLDSNKVINKGLVVHDTLNEGCLSACKHANGRDWWIILNKANTNIFYKYLISDLGINFIDRQTIGPQLNEGVGQAVFSPNGKYLALYESISDFEGAYIYIYKFNRCTGELTTVQNKRIDKLGFGGISFSPNSKLFYHSSGLVLSQTQIEQKDPLDHFEIIEIIKDQTIYGSDYFMHQLGPDGRIYISNAYSSPLIHVINKPNEEGEKCIPHSNSFSIKTYGGKGIPNMPNYRLGPIDGSNCDTLGIDNIPWCWWRHDQDTLDYLNFEFTDLSAYEVTEWVWTFGDGQSSIEQNPNHKFPKNGVYEVCLIAKNKNGADTLCKTLTIGTNSTSNGIQSSIHFEVFPNPFKDYFYINVLDYIPEKMKMDLYDLQGRLIYSKRLYEGSNGVDVRELNKGIYFLHIIEQGLVVRVEKVAKI